MAYVVLRNGLIAVVTAEYADDNVSVIGLNSVAVFVLRSVAAYSE